MRNRAFPLLVLSVACPAALAADPPSYQEQSRCVAVFTVTAELFAQDGSVPEMVTELKSMQGRMSNAAFANTPSDKVAETNASEKAEEDRLVAIWNDAQDQTAQDAALDYLSSQIDGCKALLPAE
jgi:hypothetical protein